MEAAEVASARKALARLRSGDDPSSLWPSFTRLLHRRGYHTDTPEALRASLEEIRGLGEGFDLYDLARALWEAGGAKGFPALAPFLRPDLGR